MNCQNMNSTELLAIQCVIGGFMDSKYFDHTILKADATKEDILRICSEAKKYDFASVCVNSYWTGLAADELKESNVKVCTVVGFPLGAMSVNAKAYETKDAVNAGADEIDMVINIGELKNRNYEAVYEDILAVRKACEGRILKVIIETCYLTDEEKVKACELSVRAGADFVKTSTGFGSGGATAEDVRLMKDTVNNKARVKASGGIRTKDIADIMIEAGADRLGTSATIAIYSGRETV